MSKRGKKRAQRAHVAEAKSGEGAPAAPGPSVPTAARRTEWLFLATVPGGGEPIAVRELAALGARARTHGPGQVRFHADAMAIGRVFRRARTLTSLAWRISSGAEEAVLSAATAIEWEKQLPAKGKLAVDASALHFLGALPPSVVADSAEDPDCVGTLCLIDERKGGVSLLWDTHFERTSGGHPVVALALGFAGIEPGAALALFGANPPGIVEELAATAVEAERTTIAPASGWMMFTSTESAPSEPSETPSAPGERRVVFEDDAKVREQIGDAREACELLFEVDFLSGALSEPPPQTMLHFFGDSESAPGGRGRERLAERLRTARRARHIVVSRGHDRLEEIGRVATKKKIFELDGEEWSVAISHPEDFVAEPIMPATEPLRSARPSIDEIEDPEERKFVEILAKNAHLRRRWPQKHGTDVYRLYDRDVLSVPVVVDRYADALHITIYPPDEPREPAREARWVHRAGETLGIDPVRVFVKRKEKRGRGVQHEVQAREGARTVVREAGVELIANLSDYVDTGVFLDHRDTRAVVRASCSGKRLLNLFSYTGAFTVQAAAGGARATTSVDTSQTYLDWARENLELNGFRGEEHRIVRADALEFLREHPQEESYDLVIVDPPTHSNRHGGTHVWDVQKDHAELLAALKPLLAPDGVVYFSTNFRRFRLAAEVLEDWTAKEITPGSIPPDIGDRRVHRAWRLAIRAPKA